MEKVQTTNSEVLEEPAADGSRGPFLRELVIAFQEEMHHIVACDTRGLDLMTEKIIVIPESLLPYLVQGLSCTDMLAGLLSPCSI